MRGESRSLIVEGAHEHNELEMVNGLLDIKEEADPTL